MPKQFCDVDPFISSKPINDKVFLIPGNINERQSDWYGARAYCAAHCAESVTLHSQDENDFFMNFSVVSGGQQFWIGAQVAKGNITWSNGETVDYSNSITAEEFNSADEPMKNCIHAWIDDFKWHAFVPCNTQFFIACQRQADWTICE